MENMLQRFSCVFFLFKPPRPNTGITRTLMIMNLGMNWLGSYSLTTYDLII